MTITPELITAAVGILAVLITLRSTSYTELRTLYEGLKNDFERYKLESRAQEEKYEKQIDTMEAEIQALRRYIDRLMEQMRTAGITPVPRDVE